MVTITVSVLLNVRYYYFCGYMLLRSMVIFLKQKLEIFLQKKNWQKTMLFISLPSVPFSFPLSPSLQYFLADCWVGGWDWEGHFISPLPPPPSLSPHPLHYLSQLLSPQKIHTSPLPARIIKMLGWCCWLAVSCFFHFWLIVELEDEREEDWGHFFIFEKSVERVEIIFESVSTKNTTLDFSYFRHYYFWV